MMVGSNKRCDSVAASGGDHSPTTGLTRRGFLTVPGFSAVGLVASIDTATATPNTGKRGVTYYTNKERRAARQNVETYDWAGELSASAVSSAEVVLSQYTLDDLWRYVGSQHIPRSAWLAGKVSSRPGAGEWDAVHPVDGVAFAAEPSTQWTVTNGEYTLPTNDFETYRQSGLDERGAFDPGLADDSLLVNERHPEKGPEWGVDDGLGWVDTDGDLGPAGQRWVPVAWAHHWTVVYGYRSLLERLFHAYLYTGKQKYARAASVILDRVGDVYPDFSLQSTVYFDSGGYTAENGFPNPSHGGTGRGKQLGSIWESYWVKAILRAYDAVYPAQDGDTELVSFLQKKATDYPGLAPKSSVAEIRSNIEQNLVKEILPAVKHAQIRGNIGSHQTTLALSAVIQDEPGGYTDDAIDFLLQEGGLKKTKNGWRVTGGNIRPSLLSTFDRDGFPYEGSVEYNSLVKSALHNVATVLTDAGIDTGLLPLFEQLFSEEPSLSFLNDHVPSIGDTKGVGTPGFDALVEVDVLLEAYSSRSEPELARWIYHRNGERTDGLHKSVFTTDPTAIRDELERIVGSNGSLEMDSRQLAGFGFTGLRAGDAGTNGRGVWTYYGRNGYGPDEGYGTSHCHRDTLNIGLFAHGQNLSPDLGYPEQTGEWPKRWNWTANTVSHNTVVVDEQPQNKQWVAEPKHFDHTDRVQLFDIDASHLYDAVEQYRRTTAQIAVGDDSYVVDLFCVTGGDDHHFSFHGAETIGNAKTGITTSGLSFTPQQIGTYAGPDVPKPGHGETTSYNKTVGNGFNYLYNVRRDGNPKQPFSVEWTLTDENTHLRLTMVEPVDDVALANGDPPQRANAPETLTYLLAHRSGTDLQTVFTSVIEPYQTRFVESVQNVPVESNDPTARAVRVELPGGRTDYVASASAYDCTHTVGETFSFTGAFAVYTETNQTPSFAYLNDGVSLTAQSPSTPLLELSSGRIEGVVTDFTRTPSTENTIEINAHKGLDTRSVSDIVGAWIYADATDNRNGAYEILDAKKTNNRLLLDVGEKTTVKGAQNQYAYILKQNGSFVIPLSATWNADTRKTCE